MGDWWWKSRSEEDGRIGIRKIGRRQMRWWRMRLENES